MPQAIRAERAAAAREGREPRHRRAAATLGRRHHRLSPAPDRQPVLHAEPRGSAEGAGGRHPLRRGPDAGRRRGRCQRPRQGAQGRRASRTARRSRRPCRRARSWSPPARSRTPCWRARTRRTPSSTASISSACDEDGNPVTPERVRQADDGRSVLLHRARRRPLHVSFFGDLHPSFFGNVVKAMGSAKQGYPVRDAHAGRRCRRPQRSPTPRFLARLNAQLRARSCAVDRLTPTIVEVVVRGAGRGAQLPARPVLSPAELRGAGAAGRRHAARHGRPGADRRLGRPGQGPALDDRAGDGRLVRPLRPARSPASR